MASEDLFQEVNNSETFFDNEQECVEETLEEKLESPSPKEKEHEDDTSPAKKEQHAAVETLSNENSEAVPTSNDVDPQGETSPQSADDTEHKLIQLPMGRVRNLMKLDPDLRLATNEAVFAITRATELFIASLAREAYIHTSQAKKKTIQKRDIDLAISTVDSLMFLDGAMNF